MKDKTKKGNVVLIGTRVTPAVKRRFTEVAEQNHRSISGELRVLIEQRLLDVDEEAAA